MKKFIWRYHMLCFIYKFLLLYYQTYIIFMIRYFPHEAHTVCRYGKIEWNRSNIFLLFVRGKIKKEYSAQYNEYWEYNRELVDCERKLAILSHILRNRSERNLTIIASAIVIKSVRYQPFATSIITLPSKYHRLLILLRMHLHRFGNKKGKKKGWNEAREN